MKIGIDIDGVLLDSENAYRVSAEIYSLDVLGEDRLVAKDIMPIEDRYNWTKEETDIWHRDYLPYVAENSNFMPGAIEVVKKLQEMGHSTYVITARGDFNPRMKDIALSQFENAGLKFDEYYFAVEDKGKLCEEIGIDIMIDDLDRNCKKVIDHGIKVLYFRDTGLKKIDNSLSYEVNNWGEIYKYFKNLKSF